MRTPPTLPRHQHGALLILLVIALGILAAAVFVGMLSSSDIQNQRDKTTAAALAEAKAALIGWSASRYSTSGSYTPGQLPCPEDLTLIGTANEGTAASSCTLPATGRLPWKTLKIGDIRDGYGEKLWYAISAGFRTSPINSDTPANLTVDGIPGSAVAIIFAPGPALTGQTRPILTSLSPPLVQNYLEDENSLSSPPNNKFVTTGTPGTFNDHLLIISHNDLFSVVEKRVTRDVITALNQYFSDNDFFPKPASFSDPNCLGNSSIASPKCPSSTSETSGRIPANPDTAWDSTSALRGTIGAGNWFQKNGWRELIYYAPDPVCVDGTNNCPYGTLNLITRQSTLMNQKVVVVSAGSKLPGQNRNNDSDKTTITNYFEDQNSTPSDMIYTSVPTVVFLFNDFALSIP
jgi:hypothetical protein